MAEVFSGTGTKIARMVGTHRVMDEAAEKIAQQARANAAARRNTGAYSDNFHVARVPGKKGVTDRMVYNAHPAAGAIEFGHFATNKDGAEGRFVPGQFNLIRAARG